MTAKDISLEQRFTSSQTRIEEIFSNQHASHSFISDLQKLHLYYERHFFNPNTSLAKKKKLVQEYEDLSENICAISEGRLTAEHAIKKMSDRPTQRKWDAFVGNILNTCELLFWLTAAMTSCAFCLGLGIPVIFFNPLAGLAITTGTIILMLGAAKQAQICGEEYSSFSEIEQQEQLELNTLSFFSSTKIYSGQLPQKHDEYCTHEIEINYQCIA
jgi:hypothetical protein